MSKIAWTTVTWNPMVGCSRVSEGCDLCYAISESVRKHTSTPHYNGTVKQRKDGTWDWTGTLGYAPHKLAEPLSWTRKPRRAFVNSMSDIFHPSADLEFVAAMFGVMALSTINQFQILTKWPHLAAKWLNGLGAEPAKAGFKGTSTTPP